MRQPTDQSNLSVRVEFTVGAEGFGYQIPVRLRVGDTELLASPNKNGSLDQYLPLLVEPFAAFGMACLRLAKQTGRAALDLDDYAHELLFQMAGREILVCSTMRGKTVKTNYDLLFKEWLVFAEEVQRVVVLRHPEKRSYPYWRLITEEPDPTTVASLTDPSWFAERDACFK